MTDATTSSSRILESALELFSTRGYAATSVREICEAAQITKPTLYHFFGSKEGVFRALVDGTLEEFARQTRQTVSGPGTVVERMKALARGHFAFAKGHIEVVRFLHSLIYMPEQACPETYFLRFYDDIVAQIAALIEGAVAQDAFTPGPTQIRMLVFMGAIGESVHGYLFARRPDLTPELADELVETILAGWRGPSPYPA